MSDPLPTEYDALRTTIRDRGSVRLCAVLIGLAVWGALVVWLTVTGFGSSALVPLLLLAATFEINFFIHTGVERIGRYIQVVYEERAGVIGWETTAMNYGAKFPGGLDPLFSAIFGLAALLNFVAPLAIAGQEPISLVISLVSHSAFAYRIVSARRLSAAQRALDLDRFRSLFSK